VHYRPALIPFVVLAPPGLLLRRRFPFAAPLSTFVMIAIAATIDPKPLNHITLPFFAGIAAMATFGSIPERRRAIAGWITGIGFVAYVDHEFGHGPGSLVWITGFFSVAWIAGYVLSSGTRQRAELQERIERADQERELQALAAVAEERARIARELHDIVGHSVSVMTVQASAVRRLLREDQEKERQALLTVEETGRAALAEMRRLVGVLRRPEDAPALVPQPSLEHVEKLVEQARAQGLPTELRVEGDAQELPQSIDLAAYRVVQEGLTNAIKHANATRAEVLVRYESDALELVVSDNGKGDGNGDGGGHGLVGMRERVAVSGGELSAGPRAGGGFELRARLPVSEQ